MKFLNHKNRRARLNALLAALGCSMLIVACGGGGGGDAGGGGTDPVWQTSQLLEVSDGLARSAKVDINSSGVAYAVWVQEDNTRGKVFASQYDKGVWGKPQEVSIQLEENESARDPQVVVHPDGTATAVWIEFGSPQERFVLGSTTDAQGNWLPQVFVKTNATDQIKGLRLKSSGLGTAMAVWEDTNTVFASFFNGEGFEPSEQISSSTNQAAKTPDVVVNASSGSALAVWVENDEEINNRATIFSRVFNVDTKTWTPTIVKLSRPSAKTASEPRAAMGLNGKAVVTWIETDTELQQVMARLAVNALTGAWDVFPTNLGNVTGAFPLANIDAAMDPQGRAVVAWSQPEAGVGSIKSGRYDGTNWKLLDVETTAGDAIGVQVRMDASGRAFAVWSQLGVPGYNMLANRLDAAAVAWGTPELLETDDRGTAFSPSLAVNTSGNEVRGVAVWQQADGTTDPDTGVTIKNIVANIFK